MTNFPSSQKRRALGRSRRKQFPRQSLAAWSSSHRQADPVALIERSMRGRIPQLVSLKYERMLGSPFGFFRGAVPVMAADLAKQPNTGIVNQICGDAHVMNLGAYAAPDGRLVFDINDFDETTRAPFEWDVKRLATSLVLAGRENGTKDGVCEEAVLRCMAQYRKLIDSFARMGVLDVALYQVHRLQRAEPVSRALLKAERKTPAYALEQLTEPGKEPGVRIFREEKPLLWRLIGEQKRNVLASLVSYVETLQPERQHIFAQYRPIDVAFKVVGTGSVGLRDYAILFEGNGHNDPLFLQIKEQPGSAYAPYLGIFGPITHQGQRCVYGQRAMQFQSDPFLGWTTIDGRQYIVRQLNDHKSTIAIEDLAGNALLDYAEVCGELLARGHARSGDACLLAGYIGSGDKFDLGIADFASAYANQTEADWKALKSSRRKARSKPAKR